MRYTPRPRRYTCQFEFAEDVVILCHRSLSLVDLDKYSRLIVGVRGERLGLFRWYRCVPLDQGGHDAASGLDTQRQRSHVQQKQILDLLGLVTVQNCRLNRRAVGNSLVWIDGLVQLLAVEEILK